MYLTRVTLNPMSRRVQRELAEPYQMHRSLAHCFDGNYQQSGRILFRVDIHPRTGVPTVLLQSTAEPQWAWLDQPNAQGYLAETGAANPASKAIAYQLYPGQMLAFRLRANPTIKRKREKDGEMVAIRNALHKEEDQRKWLDRKAELGGFRISNLIVAQEGDVYGWINRDGQRHRLNMISVRFDGLLQVTDPDLLWQTLEQGIGSGKGMGFGLLTLAPADR